MIDNWMPFDNCKTINKSGSEKGTIIFDIEHSNGARVTLEKDTPIAPFATTLGIYGLMFHTRFDGNEVDARAFIEKVLQKINTLFEYLNVPKDKQDRDWQEKLDKLIGDLAEQ
ncbi:MAG TPA: hypothetical protein VK783_16495 [Bacteroidia bacterium]|jgi:hypothetical protein|nr:hypothetical protein [Bacteroidia bacterium]